MHERIPTSRKVWVFLCCAKKKFVKERQFFSAILQGIFFGQVLNNTSFLLPEQKKRNKENSPSALFGLLRQVFPLNKKNSLRSNSFLFLTLQQPPPFHAKKDEAGTLTQHRFARCSLLFSCSLVACTCHPEERSDEGSVHIRHNERSNV